MLILDGCFLVELFRKSAWLIQPHEDDPIFSSTWMLQNLYHDLILLENQIPWFVLLRLFQLSEPALKHGPQEADSDVLAKLVLKFFERMMLLTEPAEFENEYQIKHVLDLLYRCLIPSSVADFELEPRHLDLVPPVTDLLFFGVKFKKGSPGHILNIKFSNGVFEIPPIRVHGNSESLFHNLIAYEECNHLIGYQFTSYAVLLDRLINTRTDVDFLCLRGIIVDDLSTKDIDLFRNMLDSEILGHQFYFGKLTEDLKKYYTSRWPRWRYYLISTYFQNNWSLPSLVGAVITILLTLMQTVFTILSYRTAAPK